MEEAERNPPSPQLFVVCFILEPNCQEEGGLSLSSYSKAGHAWGAVWSRSN